MNIIKLLNYRLVVDLKQKTDEVIAPQAKVQVRNSDLLNDEILETNLEKVRS
jgi:hypothetical protein